MSNTYIATGSRIRVYDSSVEAHEALPLGTYRVHFDQREGFSLVRQPDLTVTAERVYGDHKSKVDKIFRRFANRSRSLGAIFSGDKGQGKSLMVRMVAERAIEIGLPVVVVTEDAEGIASFIDQLDECLVIFDEFEKVFPAGGRGRENRQNQFLTLFDGMSSTKRFYCVTVNDLDDVSAYIVNRTGRFHYHIRFSYPQPAEVREYLHDQAPNAAETEIEKVAGFSQRQPLTYDHLHAISEELDHPDAKFADIIEDLNIKAIEASTYRVEAAFDNGHTLYNEVAMNLFERVDDCLTVELGNNNRTFYFSFRPRDLIHTVDGAIQIPADKLIPADDDYESWDELPLKVTLTLVGQATYAFHSI